MSLAQTAPSARHGNELISALSQAIGAMDALFADARRAVAERVKTGGTRVLDREQRAAHGLAWLATYVEALRQMHALAERLVDMGQFGETEELLVRIGCGEYLAQIAGGIPMSQGEIVRLSDLGLSSAAAAARVDSTIEQLIAEGNTARHRARLVELMRGGRQATAGACGLHDTPESGRAEVRNFA